MGVVGTLVGFFKNLMDTNEEFASKVEKIWGKVKDVFQPVVDLVVGLFDSFTEGTDVTNDLGESMGEKGLGGVFSWLMDTLSEVAEFFSKVISWISEFFAEHGEEIMTKLSEVWEKVSGLLIHKKIVKQGLRNIRKGAAARQFLCLR